MTGNLISMRQAIQAEKNAFGFYLTMHPMDMHAWKLWEDVPYPRSRDGQVELPISYPKYPKVEGRARGYAWLSEFTECLPPSPIAITKPKIKNGDVLMFNFCGTNFAFAAASYWRVIEVDTNHCQAILDYADFAFGFTIGPDEPVCDDPKRMAAEIHGNAIRAEKQRAARASGVIEMF